MVRPSRVDAKLDVRRAAVEVMRVERGEGCGRRRLLGLGLLHVEAVMDEDVEGEVRAQVYEVRVLLCWVRRRIRGDLPHHSSRDARVMVALAVAASLGGGLVVG